MAAHWLHCGRSGCGRFDTGGHTAGALTAVGRSLLHWSSAPTGLRSYCTQHHIGSRIPAAHDFVTDTLCGYHHRCEPARGAAPGFCGSIWWQPVAAALDVAALTQRADCSETAHTGGGDSFRMAAERQQGDDHCPRGYGRAYDLKAPNKCPDGLALPPHVARTGTLVAHSLPSALWLTRASNSYRWKGRRAHEDRMLLWLMACVGEVK